jgi:hypothetical protein
MSKEDSDATVPRLNAPRAAGALTRPDADRVGPAP